MALAAAPAVAWADGGASSSPADGAGPQASRSSQSAHHSVIRHANGTATPHSSGPGSARVTTGQRNSDLPAEVAPASSVRASSTAAARAATPALPKAAAQAAAVPSAAPGLGSFSATLRLNLEDLFSGTGRPVVTNPTAVVTGLFDEVLRRDPTAAELQNYLNRLKLLGVNNVVAGLYSSDAFRQNAVNNYYVELLGRTPTQQELSRGAMRLALGTPERFAASIAGSNEFYAYSASGGGPYGPTPSTTSYVNLLYRSMLGESTGPSATPLIQSIDQGLPIARAANQFVTSDAYRTVKVGEIYQVLGQAATPTDIAGYVKSWFLEGGQGGISRSLLATTANVQRIEAGLVPLPDVASAALLQGYFLSTYSDFVKGIKQQLQAGLPSLDGQLYGCKGSVDSSKCNQAFYTLMSTGGLDRGIPNAALQTATNFVQVSTLIPTQNNVDMNQSLIYPLRDPTTAALYLKGGPISAPGGIILTADNGAYVIDGHHRWSALYVVNPYTSIASIDLGYVPTPQAALEETQMSIGAREGYLPWKAADGPNLFTVDETTFKAQVFDYIWNPQIATAPDGLKLRQDDMDPNSKGYQRPVVFNDFTQFLTDSVAISGVPAGALTDQQALTYTQPIEDYLWGNVLRMRQYNQPIPGATPRADMPQPLGNAYPPYLQLLETGQVIYTLPAISSLG